MSDLEPLRAMARALVAEYINVAEAIREDIPDYPAPRDGLPAVLVSLQWDDPRRTSLSVAAPIAGMTSALWPMFDRAEHALRYVLDCVEQRREPLPPIALMAEPGKTWAGLGIVVDSWVINPARAERANAHVAYIITRDHETAGLCAFGDGTQECMDHGAIGGAVPPLMRKLVSAFDLLVEEHERKAVT